MSLRSAARAALLLSIMLAPVAAPAEPEAGFGEKLAAAAEDRLGRGVVYDGAYRRIGYPMGDVPADRGVCTDLVIRAYRALGVDLQRGVHRDMRRAFAAYPKIWGLSRPDPNIDHRRVPNLERYFARAGAALPPSDAPEAYLPGDLVSYRLPGGPPHIAVVSARKGPSGAPMIVHNIGAGPEIDDALFAFEMVGHYRFHPAPDAE